MSPIRLRGEGVEKRYGRVAALRGIDFDIAAGESVAVLGANGAGKSSLLKILAGLSRPSSGAFEARDARARDCAAHAGVRSRHGYTRPCCAVPLAELSLDATPSGGRHS